MAAEIAAGVPAFVVYLVYGLRNPTVSGLLAIAFVAMAPLPIITTAIAGAIGSRLGGGIWHRRWVLSAVATTAFLLIIAGTMSAVYILALLQPQIMGSASAGLASGLAIMACIGAAPWLPGIVFAGIVVEKWTRADSNGLLRSTTSARC